MWCGWRFRGIDRDPNKIRSLSIPNVVRLEIAWYRCFEQGNGNPSADLASIEILIAASKQDFRLGLATRKSWIPFRPTTTHPHRLLVGEANEQPAAHSPEAASAGAEQHGQPTGRSHSRSIVFGAILRTLRRRLSSAAPPKDPAMVGPQSHVACAFLYRRWCQPGMQSGPSLYQPGAQSGPSGMRATVSSHSIRHRQLRRPASAHPNTAGSDPRPMAWAPFCPCLLLPGDWNPEWLFCEASKGDTDHGWNVVKWVLNGGWTTCA